MTVERAYVDRVLREERRQRVAIVIACALLGCAVGFGLSQLSERVYWARITAEMEEYDRTHPSTCHDDGADRVCRYPLEAKP